MNPLKKVKGFTLLELLIVIFIVGVLTAVILVRGTAIGSQEVKYEAQRLKNLLIYAQQEAILSTNVLQLSTDNTSYQFLTYLPPASTQSSGKWAHDHKDRLLNYHPLPSKVKLVVSSGDVIFYPTGGTLPFQIDFYFKNKKMPYHIIGKGNGEIEVKNSHEA